MEVNLKKKDEELRTSLYLKFTNEKLENDYEESTMKGFRWKIFTICVFDLIVSFCLIVILLINIFRQSETLMISRGLEIGLFIGNFVLQFAIVFLLKFTKSGRNQKILLIVHNSVEAMNYVFLAEVLNLYENEQNKYLIILLIFQFFMNTGKVIWIKKFKESFFGFIFQICIIWILLLTLNPKYYEFYFKYNIPLSIIYFCLCIFSFMLELNLRSRFYINYVIDQRNLIFSVVNNLNQGLIILKENKIIFLNKFSKDLIYTNNFNNESPKEIKNTDDSFKILTNITNSDINDISLLEKLFSKLTYINPDLNKEVVILFNSIKTENKIFNIEEFGNKLLLIAEEVYSSFISLGKINLALNREYEVLFRKYKSENEDQFYIEFILNDITEVILNERKSTNLKCRSLYLNKIAHEFRNPISNIIELVDNFDEVDLNDPHNKNNKQEFILTSLKSICKMLLFLIKDFSFFSNFNFEVYTNPIQNIQKHLELNHNSKNNFDFKKEIDNSVKIFENKLKIDNKINSIKMDIIYENNINLELIRINTNHQIFNSLIFNLLYQAYKYTVSGSITLNISKSEDENKQPFLKFKVTHSGNFLTSSFDVFKETYFIQNLFTNFINEEAFNNSFQIILSILYCKILNTELNLESKVRGETDYTFSIPLYMPKEIDISPTKIIRKSFKSSTVICNYLIESKKLNHFKVISSPNVCANLSDEKENSNSFIKNTMIKNSSLILSPRVRIQANMLNDVSAYDFNSNFIPEPHEHDDDNSGDIQIISNYSDEDNYITNLNISKLDLNNIQIERYSTHRNSDKLQSTNNRTITHKIDYKYRVLIVDDESLIRKTLNRFFTKISDDLGIGIETNECANCFECLDLIYRNYMEQRYFDIIIIDETMPIMRGSMLINLLSKLHKESLFYKIKIVSFTSYDTVDMKNYILDQGADWVINKPINYTDFKSFSESNLFEN